MLYPKHVPSHGQVQSHPITKSDDNGTRVRVTCLGMWVSYYTLKLLGKLLSPRSSAMKMVTFEYDGCSLQVYFNYRD